MGVRFDEKGLVVDGIDQVKQTMVDRANILLAPYLNSTQLRTDDSSVIGRIFSITSLPAVQNAQILPSWVNALDFNTAEGLQLDFLGAIHRVPRRGSSQAVGMAMLFGDIGTLIPENSRISNTRTGDVYTTNSDVTLTPTSVNGIEVVITSIVPTYTITYSINGYLSESPNIIVQLGVNDTTTSQVANRIVDAVNSQSSYLTAIKNNDNSVKIVITDQYRTGDFVTSSALNIARSYKPVNITSDSYASSEAAENTITAIGTSIVGWRGVTNPFKIDASQGVEDDEDYRYRMKLNKGGNSVGTYNSVLFALNQVNGVTFASVQQNSTSNTTGSGITNNGIAVTVQGGNEDDIALALFDYVPLGIETVGDIVKTVTDINGGKHTRRFSRPQQAPIQISMSLTVYPDFPIGGQTQIKQAIVEYFNELTVGEDIYYSRLYEPINSIRGFSVRNLKISRVGQPLGTDDIVINHNELATISHENIQIGGS